MLQGHAMDGWVRPQDRSSEWFWLSQFLGGLPAPIFLFLVGVSLAIVLDRMRAKGVSQREIVGKVLRRGGWILQFIAHDNEIRCLACVLLRGGHPNRSTLGLGASRKLRLANT